MKKDWTQPVLEVLNVSETMKNWVPRPTPRDPDPGLPEDPVFDS